MSNWKITGPPRFFEGVGMVYPVTKGGSRFNAAEEDELKALLAGWISVDDRLPKHGEWYLVSATTEAPGGGERVTTMAFFDSSEDSSHPLWLAHNDTESDEWSEVTHWMPLLEAMPKPPTN